MLQKIISTVVKSVVAYIVLLILGRIMGRKMISRITFFDFLIGVTLGSLAVRMSLGNESSVLLTTVSAIVITSMALITDQFNMKSSLFRKVEEGKPILMIQKGKLLYEGLSKAKISMNKLLMLLRQKNVFNIEDVDYAIFENDGHLTVLLRPEKLSVNAGEMKISKPGNKLSIDLIVDGKILLDNLTSSGHTQEWLMQQLKIQGFDRPDQIFYASLNQIDKLYVAPFH